MTQKQDSRDRQSGREQRAAVAVTDALFITERTGLEAAMQACAQARVIGLDTEFVRERTFYARPGLIQVSDGDRVWLLDPIALPSMPELAEVLSDERITKVLHSVGEDLEILATVTGALPHPLFDTQLAAAMLGEPLQIRYEHLVAEIIGTELPGGKARNNWCRRPLAPDLLEYAAQDVIWLPRLCAVLSARLAEAGRLDWLEEDCARLVERARDGAGAAPLSRIKGAGRLDNAALARLDALAGWREEQARERDLPRRFVLDDAALLNLAQTAQRLGDDQAATALPARERARYGESLHATLEIADLEGFERPPWIDPLDPKERETLRALQQAVGSVADELGVEPAVIASKRELTRLVRGEHPDWLDGWRGRVLDGRLPDASATISPTDSKPR